MGNAPQRGYAGICNSQTLITGKASQIKICNLQGSTQVHFDSVQNCDNSMFQRHVLTYSYMENIENIILENSEINNGFEHLVGTMT